MNLVNIAINFTLLAQHLATLVSPSTLEGKTENSPPEDLDLLGGVGGFF